MWNTPRWAPKERFLERGIRRRIQHQRKFHWTHREQWPPGRPLGVALAPNSGLGEFSGDLLVGNFGNGEIDAFSPTNGVFLGTLDGSSGQPLVNSGLWAIDFGNSANNPDALYFNAGINGEADGLFGDIQVQVTPEPAHPSFGSPGLG